MNKEAIQIMVDYVEGRMDIAAFKQEFDNNKNLMKILKKPFDLNYVAYREYNFNVYEYIMKEVESAKENWNKIDIKYTIYVELCRWLNWFHIDYNHSYTKYEEDYNTLLDIEPSWLEGVNDEGILDKIIAEMPKELSKTRKIQWGKERIKEIFKCDKSYPRWIQGSEWPIINGKPLVFSHQSKEQKDDERIYYYFYDPDTGKQTVVEQFY